MVVHYFPRVHAGVLAITRGTLSAGERIHLKGHTTDFVQRVQSLQIDRNPVQKAAKGTEVGVRLRYRVRVGDFAYRVENNK